MRKYILILCIITLISSCGSNEPKTVKEEAHTEEAPSNFVSLTELQMKTAGIESSLVPAALSAAEFQRPGSHSLLVDNSFGIPSTVIRR